MSRVALVGGAFDPPHFGHSLRINELITCGLVDQVWVVPSGERPDKAYHAPTHHRRALVKLFVQELFGDEPTVHVEWCELQGEVPAIGTAHLLAHLQRLHPKREFLFSIGEELVENLPHWIAAEQLRQRAKFIVHDRPGLSGGNAPGFQLVRLRNPYRVSISLSSTTLRTMLREGRSIAGLAPASVVRYISQHRLYCAD